MVGKKSKTKNVGKLNRIKLVRKKDEAIYLITITFTGNQGPTLLADDEGNLLGLRGGNYKIKRATWASYNTRGKGAFIKPDNPVRNYVNGPVTGGKIIFIEGNPVIGWDRADDFVVTGPGVKTHVKRMSLADYELEVAAHALKEERPYISRGRAQRIAMRAIGKIIDKAPRKPYMPVRVDRRKEKKPFTRIIEELREQAVPLQKAKIKALEWDRKNNPSEVWRTRQSINRSVRRVYNDKKVTPEFEHAVNKNRVRAKNNSATIKEDAVKDSNRKVGAKKLGLNRRSKNGTHKNSPRTRTRKEVRHGQ